MLWYISFASETGFLGATVVEADSPPAALQEATRLGINPGGEAAIWWLAERDDGTIAEIAKFRDRLVWRDECEATGGKLLSDLSPDELDMADAASCVIDEDENIVEATGGRHVH